MVCPQTEGSVPSTALGTRGVLTKGDHIHHRGAYYRVPSGLPLLRAVPPAPGLAAPLHLSRVLVSIIND